MPRALAIGAVSVGFTLEHYDPSASLETNLRALLFVFAMSCALGALLEASRNLYAVIACHGVLNLCLARVLPLPVGLEGTPILPASLAGTIFMFGVFAAVVIEHQLTRRSARSKTLR